MSTTDYPPVPPGVKTFDPRRLRRSERQRKAASMIEDLESKLKESEVRRKMVLTGTVADNEGLKAKLKASEDRVRWLWLGIAVESMVVAALLTALARFLS